MNDIIESGCNFCKGGVFNNGHLMTKSLDETIFKPNSRFIKRKVDGSYICPLGCTSNPKTLEASMNAAKNNGSHSVCRNNEYI